MMMLNNEIKKTMLPTLRFPEFQGKKEWEQAKVGDVILTITPPSKLMSSNYLKEGKYPIIDQSQNYYCGWTNDEEAVVSDDFPLIIFGDHTCILKIVNEPFVQGADGIKIIKPKKIVETSFLYQNLQSNPVVQEGYKRHFSVFKDKIVFYPSNKSEQQQIADCLSSIDELITAQTKKLDDLKAHKKGLMQQLFPAEGKVAPKLRFSEFRDVGEWKKIRLSKLAKRIIQRNTSDVIGRVLTNSASDGIIDQRDYFDRDIANKNNLENYFVVEQGDYVYNPRVSNIAPVGPISKNKIGKGVMSPLYTVFRFNDSVNDFYEYYFKSTLWHQQLKKIANCGARHDRMNITNDDFMNMFVPDILKEEQQKIADCLSSIDELIAAQSQRLEALKNHKKGLMQQLFPNIND